MEGKTMTSTLEIAGVLSPTLEAAIKNAVANFDAMSDGTLAAAGSAEKLVAEISAQENVLNALQKGYADYIVSGQESSEAAQALADTIQELSGELEDNKDVLQAAETAAKKLANSQEDMGDAYTQLESKIGAQEDELEKLRREYANVVLEQGKYSSDAKQLEGKISSLSGELNKNKKKLQDVGDAAEEAGNQAENSGEGYTVLKDVIADLASDAIQSAIEKFKELATEGDNTLAMLEARSGASAEAMKGYEDVLYTVYNAGYGESLGDVGNALSTVTQMMGDLDNASLAQVTKNAMALEDVFGFDTTESLRSANALMKQFGVSSDEAFNLIVQGAQNGLNQNGDLMDVINEYSNQFATAGFSAEDMFNMLQNGVEAGTWSVDKLGDAVKEYNIRMSDGTVADALKENRKALGMTEKEVKALSKAFSQGGEAGEAAMKSTLDAIMAVEDDTKRYQLGVEMFGTMWEDLGEEAVQALFNTEGGIKAANNAMSQMDAAAYDTLSSKLTVLGRTIEAKVFQPLAKLLLPAAKNAVDFVTRNVGPAVDWVVNNLPTIGVVLAGIAAAIVAFKWGSLVSGISKAVTAFKAFGAALSANPIGLVILGITALVAAFTYLWNNCEGFRNFWINLWDSIKTAASKAWEGITAAWSGVSGFFSGIWESISSNPILSGLFNYIAAPFLIAWTVIKTVWNAVAGFFSGIWGLITGDGTLADLWSKVSQPFADGWEAIKGIWGGVVQFFQDIWNGITGVFSGVGEWFSGIFSGTGDKVSESVGDMTSWASTAWDSITGFFGNAATDIGGWFSGISMPSAEDISGFASTAWSSITGFFGNAATDIGGWFANIGMPSADSISGFASTAWSSITGFFGNAASNISTWFTGITMPTAESISGFASTAWSSITSFFGNAASNISTWFTGIIMPTADSISGFASTAWSSITGFFGNAAANIGTWFTGITMPTPESISGFASTAWSSITGFFGNAASNITTWFTGITVPTPESISGFATTAKTNIESAINAARDAVSAAVEKIKGFFDFEWSLPKIALPHFSIQGEFSFNPLSVPTLGIDWYAKGGIMTKPTIFGAAGNNLLAGGEAGAEAILPLSALWDNLETFIRAAFNTYSTTGGTPEGGLTAKAGELLTLDNFSLGSLADGTNIVVYYDFSNFTWSPQIQTGGTGDNDEDDLMARLRAHEAEFFDWLEEFIQMREVAQYA